jgi:hypothetical protein
MTYHANVVSIEEDLRKLSVVSRVVTRVPVRAVQLCWLTHLQLSHIFKNHIFAGVRDLFDSKKLLITY